DYYCVILHNNSWLF
nr:immunoglobulin light chain junction region [Macaca mulatta]